MDKRQSRLAFRPSGSPLLFALLAAIVDLAIVATTARSADDLSPDDESLLMQLDSHAAARAIEIATKVQQWESAINQALSETREAGKGIQTVEGDPEQVAKVVFEVVAALEQTLKDCPQLRSFLDYDTRIVPIVREANDKWQSAGRDQEKAKRKRMR